MIGDLDAFVQNPNCSVNVSGITSRGANISIELHHSTELDGEECEDDDAMLSQTMGMETTCLEAAASGIGCTMVGVPEACQCACRAQASGGVVSCHDNNEGLAELYGDASHWRCAVNMPIPSPLSTRSGKFTA